MVALFGNYEYNYYKHSCTDFYAFTSFGKIPKITNAGSCGETMLNFLRNCQNGIFVVVVCLFLLPLGMNESLNGF